MGEYKCEFHKLDICCLGCVKAWIARHDRMKHFIQQLAHESVYKKYDNLDELNWAAHKLLEEIGILK